MQMTFLGAKLEAARQDKSPMMEASGALWHALSPHMDLRQIMLLAGTCRAWRQLITLTPVLQLSAEVRHAVLPSGLTTSLPLLQLLKQQAQLLQRITGKHSDPPQIQPLSFEPLDPMQQIRDLEWSPCVDFEDASRYIVLSGQDWFVPMVIDLQSGQQVCPVEANDASAMGSPCPGRVYIHATWLTAQNSLAFHPAKGGLRNPCRPAICLADVCSHSNQSDRLPGALHDGHAYAFSVPCQNGPCKDILCWVAQPAVSRRLEDQIIVYDLPSCRPLYQLMCPDHVMNSFLQFHGIGTSHGQHRIGLIKGKAWAIAASEVMPSPSKESLAVAWGFRLLNDSSQPDRSDWKSTLLGLSIHSSLSGGVQHSMVFPAMKAGMTKAGLQLSWLPHSSCITFVTRGGLHHLITSSGELLWRVSIADRSLHILQGQALQPGGCKTLTQLKASPCGRWILVIDHFAANHDQGASWGSTHLTVVEVPSGRIVHSQQNEHPEKYLRCAWSESGNACLFQETVSVLAYCPCAGAAPSFRYFPLVMDGLSECRSVEAGYPLFTILSLSPCGSTVIGYVTGVVQDDIGSLQQWQLPSASAVAADSSQLEESLEPSICADLPNMELNINCAAWHPMWNARVYALGDQHNGVCLMDARTNTCIKAWDVQELHGSAAHEAESSCDDGVYPEAFESFDQVLRWSKDGRKLAFASDRRCRILCFSDSST